MYKEASKLKLRIPTPVGQLSVEQMWGLSIPQLDEIAVSLEDSVNKSQRKSFIAKSSVEDKVAKLRFDITLDILEAKVASSEAEANRLETKAHNDKILSLIAEKEDNDLKDMSVEDLQKLLK